jgi:hypothetical protein
VLLGVHTVHVLQEIEIAVQGFPEMVLRKAAEAAMVPAPIPIPVLLVDGTELTQRPVQFHAGTS